MHAAARVDSGISIHLPSGHAMDGLILAIDLGKFNSVCCWYDTSTKSATLRHARTIRTVIGRDLTRQPVLGVVVTQVERNFSDEADVVLTKAGPGLVCDPGGRPMAVTANSRVNPESSNVRIATRKNRRRTVRGCGIIVDTVHLPGGIKCARTPRNLSCRRVRCSVWFGREISYLADASARFKMKDEAGILALVANPAGGP